MSKTRRIGKLTLILFGLAAFANVSRATLVGFATAGGYNFTNFDGPGSGTNAGAGTNSNGIANNGAIVGFGIDNNGVFTNFDGFAPSTFTVLTNFNVTNAAMAFGINSAGDVVGTDGNGNAVILPNGGSLETLPVPGTPATAFGVNDNGNIVGQYMTAVPTTPGFYMANSAGANFITINAPAGPDTVNAQGVNDNGLIVGFYVGTDGQDHGFMANVASAIAGSLTGTPIIDPTIPPVSGEPGATFVFSQILGINDQGIAVGYYGDSTTSQHGFFYNTLTGKYTFLDDPSEAFNNGVEVTQITGINNAGDITGFYSDANGVFHGFAAAPVPEPAFFPLAGLGLTAIWFAKRRSRR